MCECDKCNCGMGQSIKNINSIENMTMQNIIEAITLLGSMPSNTKDMKIDETDMGIFLKKLMKLTPEMLEESSRIVVIGYGCEQFFDENVKAFLKGGDSIILMHALNSVPEEERKEVLAKFKGEDIVFTYATDMNLKIYLLLGDMHHVRSLLMQKTN